MFIYKDYQIINGVLLKEKMTGKHLLYKAPAFGSPCIDAINVWDKYKDHIDTIKFIVRQTIGPDVIFEITRDEFEGYKTAINYGYGLQYAVDKKYWKITYV